MLTLYHAPMSRSSRIVNLIDEMGIAGQIDIITVNIPRQDGTGARDPLNPHPEGKVPALVHDGALITESAAIILYLTTLFPDTGMSPAPGTPAQAACLGWLFWYGSVMEPVMVLERCGISHPGLTANFRGHPEVVARISAALAKGPWLLGDRYSAVDLLIHSPYAFFKGTTPDDPLIRDWVARCMARASVGRTRASDLQRQTAAAA